MDADGFLIPKPKKPKSIQKKDDETSPSPPPPIALNTTSRKRKRGETLENKNKKRVKLSKDKCSIYEEPCWASLPPSQYKFELEVIKNGVSLNKIELNKKSHFIFGRDPDVDILTLHPSCSRYHAVLQHRKNGQWFLFDFGSTHFTKLNHKKLFAHKYYKIDIGNIIQFGSSQRMYILNGPKELEKEVMDQPQITRKTKTENSMESMIKQLAKRSKTEKINDNKQKTIKVNVWGIDEYDESDINNNDFDEQEAKTNNDTRELYNQLESKRKQHRKLEGHLRQKLSQQRSNKELNQTECMKIEKMRRKIDNLEDDIDSLSTKIAKRLKGNDYNHYDDNEDNDIFEKNSKYFDDDNDDDDDYFDRIKTIRRKKGNNSINNIHHSHALSRNARILNDNKKSKVRDYDSYKDELDKLEMKISEIEQALRDIEYRKKVNIADKKEKLENDDKDNVEIDSILNDLKSNDNKYSKLKRLLNDLMNEKHIALKMVNLLRPAYFQVMQNEPDRIRLEHKSHKHSPKHSPKRTSTSPNIKPGSLADIASKMKNEEMEKQKHEQKIRNETKQRLIEREEEIKKAENARIIAMKKFEEEQRKLKERRNLLKMRDEENKNKVGLIVYKKRNDDINKDNKLESEFAKILGKSTLHQTQMPNDDEIQNDDFIKAADDINANPWIPPSEQNGDGRTKLNDKFGY